MSSEGVVLGAEFLARGRAAGIADADVRPGASATAGAEAGCRAARACRAAVR